jgi:hypothetical protein
MLRLRPRCSTTCEGVDPVSSVVLRREDGPEHESAKPNLYQFHSISHNDQVYPVTVTRPSRFWPVTGPGAGTPPSLGEGATTLAIIRCRLDNSATVLRFQASVPLGFPG